MLAKKYFPGESALGKRIKPADSLDDKPPVERKIVGVVGDVKFGKLTSGNEAEFYVAHAQFPFNSVTLVTRCIGEPTRVLPLLHGVVTQMDETVPLYQVRTMNDYVSAALSQPKLNMALLLAFAGIGAVLTATAVYGVMAYSVAQRTQEIGIRMAVGAQKSQILRLVVGNGLQLIVVSITIGVFAALLLTKVLASLTYGVAATDVPTLSAVALFLGSISLAACWLPGRRAASIDPIRALRAE